MILQLEIENFRGRQVRTIVTCAETQALGNPVTWITGAPSAGKTTVVEALLLLQRIARGMTRVDQYCSGDGYSISANPVRPVDISLAFATGRLQYLYGIRLEYEGVRHWQVENEWIKVNGALIFSRSGNHVEIGGSSGGVSYELDRSIFVLPTFATQDANHPVARVRDYLANLFVLIPTPPHFSDVNIPGLSQNYLDPYGRNIGAWAVAFFGVNMSAYPWFVGLLARYIPGFYSLKTVAMPNGHSRLFLVRRHADGTSDETPLSMASYREKLIFTGSLLVTVQQTFGNISCVWDDFDQMMEASSSLASELHDAFVRQGQLVFTSARNCGFQNVRIQRI